MSWAYLCGGKCERDADERKDDVVEEGRQMHRGKGPRWNKVNKVWQTNKWIAFTINYVVNCANFLVDDMQIMHSSAVAHLHICIRVV